MKIAVTNEVDVPIEALVAALADSPPEDFAKFWLLYAEVAKALGIDLDEIGRAMAKRSGSIRQKPLRAILHAMEAETYRMDREEGKR